MFTQLIYTIVLGIFLFMQGCGTLGFKEDASEAQRIHEEQYQPYKIKNTVEGYREFIGRYPDNVFVDDAQMQIESLEFAPYEQADTIEGYMEFKLRYPDNPHCSQCDGKIEQLECKRCEEIATMDAYREFLLKYPESASAGEIQKKLDALEESEQLVLTEVTSPVKGLTSLESAVDGLKIMTMVSERDRGEDYIISTSWKLEKKGRAKHSMVYMEKRKNYGARGEFIYKSVVRYIEPTDYYGTAILTWNFKNSERLFWSLRFRRKPQNAKMENAPELLRPPAESDFSLPEYYDINVDEEKHVFLRSEDYKDRSCVVVESVPVKNLKYIKRITWIDQQHLIPLKIEYYHKERAPWKTLYITWQQKYNVWLWKKAEVTNFKEGWKTSIVVNDVRVNLGLTDRDFTRNSLDTKILGF